MATVNQIVAVLDIEAGGGGVTSEGPYTLNMDTNFTLVAEDPDATLIFDAPDASLDEEPTVNLEANSVDATLDVECP